MYHVREATSEEFDELGSLMVEVYSQLEGFPGPDEIPDYYDSLKNVGDFTKNPKTKLIVAVSNNGKIDGGLVYFGDMRYYGAGEESTLKQQAAAFRLLAVDPKTRGKGLGKLLVEFCFDLARKQEFKSLMIHSTKYMMVAWKMYERMGFERFPEIDFEKNEVKVYGFQYKL
ncbi:GNAT family N-acetyltransferase [Pseudotenacibaculum sp. MALMAid0570]|uniref:GNAT family N-acetyltransferase n=1 Tax=Pseudotenacibaculum sp. MALMAid0570 TaxID=3143938 RepID=UPI0032DF3B1F